MNDSYRETSRALLFALNLQGNFSNTLNSRRIREYLDSGCSLNLIKPLIKRLPEECWQKACRELDQARDLEIRPIAIFDEEYPPLLLEISDPPPLIFVKGTIPKGFPIAVVGSRRPSSYGSRVSRTLGQIIAEAGGSVVSGLAYGIDSAAHKGALKANEDGKAETAGVAVLGSGFLELYPSQHRDLADALIASNGALVSEYGLRQHPRRDLFPRRNRIISGFCRAVIVVEAAARSGSLITARLALEQNRTVLALPGQIDSPMSAGTNELLRQGAEVLNRLEELYSLFPDLEQPRTKLGDSKGTALELIPEEQRNLSLRLLEVLRISESSSVEQLADLTELSCRDIYPVLSRLELEGMIERDLDQRYRLLVL